MRIFLGLGIFVFLFSNSAYAAGARYGLQCGVKTVQIDDRDHFAALLECGSDLVNVRTSSALKSAMLTTAKQAQLPIVVDVAASNTSTSDVLSIYMP